MEFKEFGIYTLNNHIFVVMISEIDRIEGFKIHINELSSITNSEVNKYLKDNFDIFNKGDQFVIYDPNIINNNFAYLGQVSDRLQKSLVNAYKNYLLHDYLFNDWGVNLGGKLWIN